MVFKAKKDAEEEDEGDVEGGSDGDDEDEVGDAVDLKQAHLQQGDVAYACGNLQLAFRYLSELL